LKIILLLRLLEFYFVLPVFRSKETTSLGAARILEMWTEKLAQETTPVNSLLEMSALFGQLEFFVFSYIPGHIDAVKNCSRNILGFLTKVYARLALQSALQLNINYFEELLKKVLSQPTHVKFIAMSCVVKNSPLSTKFLKIQPDLPISLLCSQRTCKNAVCTQCFMILLYSVYVNCSKFMYCNWYYFVLGD